MLAIPAVGTEDGMAVDATPGGDIPQRPGVRADRFHPGPRSQVRDPILNPDDRERTQEPPAIHDYRVWDSLTGLHLHE